VKSEINNNCQGPYLSFEARSEPQAKHFPLCGDVSNPFYSII